MILGEDHKEVLTMPYVTATGDFPLEASTLISYDFSPIALSMVFLCLFRKRQGWGLRERRSSSSVSIHRSVSLPFVAVQQKQPKSVIK
jgi:hypothetical protein